MSCLNNVFMFCLDSVYQQLIKDMVSIGETTNWLTRRSVYSKYRSLKCHIECLEQSSDEFKKIQGYVNSSETSSTKMTVLNVFSIHRPVEEGAFSHDIENKKFLFHASKVRTTWTTVMDKKYIVVITSTPYFSQFFISTKRAACSNKLILWKKGKCSSMSLTWMVSLKELHLEASKL